MVFNTFEEQYAYAKQQCLLAIEQGNNVVLWGQGANGKSHLNDSLRNTLPDQYYAGILHPMPMSEFLELHNFDNFILEVNSIDHILVYVKDYPFVFINMNTFRYPEISYLRSGRVSK
jgi:energy-coupling factor transporter ATP-binding protein EcfA2